MKEKKDIRILAFESSCDETAAAVVTDGRTIRSSAIDSQVAEHQLYGGVVPEIASRRHCENIVPVVKKALGDAGCTLAGIDAVAVTAAPGLIGALLVGVNYAKGLAYAAGAKLILECLERGLYPSWDAQNKWSAALAKKLGYRYSHTYTVYETADAGKENL